MTRFVSHDANITQFIGACVKGDTAWLVMEYIEVGGTRWRL